ncbi:MAG: hypothetical protein KME52_18655 [Desmonostoc geniculatum HA4340-LM1]|jgi:hypothetical protein|nr:hypothetical protein [Desmonostoc geniculatum HA4340-LM1]
MNLNPFVFLTLWDATPSGRIEMLIQNPDAAAQFQAGKEHYVDFTEA